MTLRLSGIQMRVTQTVAQNEERIRRAIEHSVKSNTDFLVTPEAAVSGMCVDFNQEEVQEAVKRLTTLAASLRVGLLLSTFWREHNESYNQVRVYTPSGEYAGAHSKILRCSVLEDPGAGEMNVFRDAPLRTFTWHGVTFGILVCNDLWATPGYTTLPNPYLPWQLKKLGAQLIIHAVNSGSDLRYRFFAESSVELWALSLGIPIVEVNALLNEEEQVNARSGLVLADGTRSVVLPDTGEHIFDCNISL